MHWSKDDGRIESVPPAPLAGSAIDGSRTVHAAVTYSPASAAPLMDKSKAHSLFYSNASDSGEHGNDRFWTLRTEGKDVANFTDDELRVAIVYRARCFANEMAKAEFDEAPPDALSLDTILSTLSADLAARGKLSAEKARKWQEIPRLELSLLLLDTYIRYPLPQSTLIPFNYCMLPRAPNAWAQHVASWIEPLLVLLCDS